MPPPGQIVLSACIIARDEERDLPDCLASVAFCDEVVVVDSGSTDRTIAVAEAAGARVVHQPWLGFAAQRNVALDAARGEWVLEVDADERVTRELREEIEAFVAAAPAGVDLGGLPRRELLAGRPLGASAKYPNYCHRLLRRGTYRHDEARLVHEGLVPHGPVHPFEGELRHLLAPTWRAAATDAWRYAKLESAQLAAARSPRAVVRGAALRPAAKLVYRLVVDGGWRDGLPGVAKIGLDCATDAAVWARHALVREPRSGDSGVAGGAHYGSRRFPRGEPRVVGVALGAADAARAAAWLAAAAGDGLDVALVSDSGAHATAVRTRPLDHGGPLSLIRALDAEEQLRTLDAVVPFGRRAARILPLVPETLRGLAGPVGEAPELERLRTQIGKARAA